MLPTDRDVAHVILDDLRLLQTMMDDNHHQPSIYKPSKCWLDKTKNAIKEIEHFGLSDFRGSSNSIGTSFADNLYCDARSQLSFGVRRPFKYILKKVFPFKQIFDAQVRLTHYHAQKLIKLRAYICLGSQRVADLMSKYTIPYSLAGGCADFFTLNGTSYSHFYINLLDTHDQIAEEVDFTKAKSFFEIGGGFGGNLHLLIENYPNLKKFVYLDIPPNLYVGTQYLKSFYGTHVRDYQSTKNLKEITFQDNDDLEIICIAPWQIEQLKVSIDIFYNARSFVEMTPEIIKNYIRHIANLPNSDKTKILLVSYGLHNLARSLHPDLLQTYFNRKFKMMDRRVLPDGDEQIFIYISDSR